MRCKSWALVIAILFIGTAVSQAQSASAGSTNTRLFSKIYGCEAAVTIGNTMGVPVEGWSWERIENSRPRARLDAGGRPSEVTS